MGINIVINSGSTQFLKKVSLIEMVFFAIATILIIPGTLYLSSSANVFGSMSLPLVFFYAALFVLTRDIGKNITNNSKPTKMLRSHFII